MARWSAAISGVALAAGLGLGLQPEAGRAEPAAVGRISYGLSPEASGTACTGTLVAPDLVLTAAHCLDDPSDGHGRDPGAILFAPGWTEGEAAAFLHGGEVIRAAPRGLPEAQEAALLRLRSAAPATPLALAEAPGDGPFLTLGYARTPPRTLRRHDGCLLLRRSSLMLALDCPAVSGHSGGPVLVGTLVAAVIVGRGAHGDPTGTYAVTVPEDIAARIRAARAP